MEWKSRENEKYEVILESKGSRGLKMNRDDVDLFKNGQTKNLETNEEGDRRGRGFCKDDGGGEGDLSYKRKKCYSVEIKEKEVECVIKMRGNKREEIENGGGDSGKWNGRKEGCESR